MRLGEMLNNFINQTSVSGKTTGSTETQQLPNNIAAQIKALTPGQILQGEVLENAGDTVKLLVNVNGESVPLQAKLEQNVMLALGKSLLFQVKNNGSTLSLSPLFENMGMEQNAGKALESASLPINATTMSMTGKLMQEGMPIDKNSLQQIYQEVLSNQNAELMDIIDLHKLGMPVTEENINQIHSYKGMTHQLAGGIGQLSQDLLKLLQDMTANGQGKDIPAFLRAVLQPGAENALQEQGDLQGAKTVLTEAGIFVAKDGAASQEAAGMVQMNSGEPQGIQNPQDMTSEQLLKALIGQLEQSGGEKEGLTKLVNSDSFKNALNELIQKELMLRPESADKDGVQDMYQKLGKQLNAMAEALNKIGQEQSPLGKTVQNMSQNINFLNQMNSMYAYVQLPIKLSEGNAHGELYVYSNKKHLASNDGEVSALLHLDMEHLGPVDVHVKLKDTKVSTQFFLKDEDMLDFLYEHMDMLTERLKKRGYDMTYRMTVRGETENADEGNTTFQELLRENSNIPTLVNYSFDVRA
ncbi:MAG: flagellar hook-length control protein FliK [Lachnospiraceae bacterium]|nr:flagellar hook-length control protein FliK [Lachnospiraceae bacterium]